MIVLLLLFYMEMSWSIYKRKSKFYHIPSDLGFVNLGSTYAYYGIDMNLVQNEIKSANFALIPQYLYYDRLLLKKYSNRIKKGAQILIVLPNFVFCEDGREVGFHNKEYYLFLKQWEIPGFRMKKYLSLRYQSMREPFFHEREKEKNKWRGHVATHEEKVAHCKKRIADWEKNIGVENREDFVIPREMQRKINENIALVIEMIDFCTKNGYKPVLLTMPTSTIMKEHLRSGLVEKCLWNPIKEIMEKRDVDLWNYLDNEMLSGEELYLNSDCLNEKGRILLCRQILKTLE